MRRILVISSYVAKGTVGLQATLPALIEAGFTATIAVPTIVLSNHPGFQACAGTAIEPEILGRIVDAIDGNGWLGEVDAVMTGYLPSAAHAAFAESTVKRVNSANPRAVYLADPVIGDDPSGLYVGGDTAAAIRDLLLPLANIITPNRFELSWLSAMPVSDAATAITAARALAVPTTAATSIPDGANRLSNILVTRDAAPMETVDRLLHAPHGTGDYFAGAFLARIMQGISGPEALTAASAQTSKLLQMSLHDSDLATATQQRHIGMPPK